MPSSFDGSVDFRGGQNDGTVPDKIERTQYAKGINVTCKNGALSPREKFIHIPIKVITEGKELGTSYQQIFDKGRFQGEKVFVQDNNNSFAISVRGGIIFKIDPKRKTAEVLRTATDDRIQNCHRRVSIEPAGRFMVIWDYPNMPIVIDNNVARRANFYRVGVNGSRIPEIPVSRLGVFCQSRLCVSNGLAEFGFSDPVGSRSFIDAPITFTESLLPNSPYVGQFFSLQNGFNNPKISAMGVISSRSSLSRVRSTKYGPLMIATRNSIYIYDVNTPRNTWENSTLGQLELAGTGIVGHRAFANVNSDIMFQDIYGNIHSLNKNSSDERQSWATTKISKEVENWLMPINKDFLDIGILSYYNNKLFVGAKPERIKIRGLDRKNTYDYYHNGMVVLELDNASSITQDSPPVWAGLYEGVRPMEMYELDGDFYVISKDRDGNNKTYLMDNEAKYDQWNEVEKNIKSRIYFRAFDHETPFVDKKLNSLEIMLSNISNDFSLSVFRKPIHESNWDKWGEFKTKGSCVSDKNCCDETQCVPSVYPNYGIKTLSFGRPKEVSCDVLSKSSNDFYREMQIMVEIEGSQWQLNKVRIKADIESEPESSRNTCGDTIKKFPILDCNKELKNDLDLYSICPAKETE